MMPEVKYPVNVPDPIHAEAFWLQPAMVSVQPELDLPDPTSRIHWMVTGSGIFTGYWL